MLSILPGYERSRDRDSDRPFKSYPHPSLNQHSSPYYNPFSNPSFLSSFQSSSSPSSSSPINSSGKTSTDTAMDLRPQQPQHSMYDSRMYHDAAGLIDMSSHISHRIPSIKQESHHHQQNQQSLHDLTYPQINTNPAHQGYTSLAASNMAMRHDMLGMHRGRPEMGQPDMGSPPQASLPSLNHTANSPQASSQAATNLHNSVVGLNNSSDRSDHSGPSSPEDSTVSPTVIPPISSSPRMPPKKRPISQVSEDLKDSTYWEKRKKNNESAKRSREARRMKEEQIAVRVVYLEQENLQLRTEVSLLKNEIEKLRVMLYNS